MSIFERENLVRAMITGDKPADRHHGAPDARGPSLIALALGAAVVGATAYFILQYDPEAFALRSAESFEHRSGGGETDADEYDGEKD
jgi:prolipoprotein diacylglyceryltransferase